MGNPKEGDPASCERSAGDPVDAAFGVLVVGPVVDVHLVGAFDDDIILERYYGSHRPHPGDTRIPAALGAGWVHNFQSRIVTWTGSNLIGFVRADGEGYFFYRDTSTGATRYLDKTGRGWRLEQDPDGHLAGCDLADATTTHWRVTAVDGRCWELDASGLLRRMKTYTGKPVMLSYDDPTAPTRLTRVSNTTGQAIRFEYENDLVKLIRLDSAADTPVLVSYSRWTSGRTTQLDRVCYGELVGLTCQDESWSYLHFGGTSYLLLGAVAHGSVLTEYYTYEVGGDRVVESANPSGRLRYTYGGAPCPGAPADSTYHTQVEDLAVDASDPWRSACLSWDKDGRLLFRSSPAGCQGNTRKFTWTGTGRLHTYERGVPDGSTASSPAKAETATRSYEDDGRVNGEAVDVEGKSEWGRSSTTVFDTQHPLLPATLTRKPGVCDPSVAGAPATQLLYDDRGNVRERHQTGCTRDESGQDMAFDYVSRTRFRTVPGLGLTGQPELASGPDLASAPPNVWHTMLVYYGASGDGDAARAHRLREVRRFPGGLGGGPDPSTPCALPSCYVEKRIVTYDEFGRPFLIEDDNGTQTKTRRDAFGRVLIVDQYNGVGWDSTVTSYDTAGRVTSRSYPGGYLDSYRYESSEDEGGFERLRAVTRGTQLASNGLPKGSERTEYYYFSGGQGLVTREVSFSNPDAALGTGTRDREERRTYTQRLLQERRDDADTAIVRYSYQPETGALLSETDYGDPPRTTATTYDSGRVKSRGDTANGYDPPGNVTSTTDGLLRTSTFAFDDLGRLVESQTPNLAGSVRFTYAAHGGVATRADPDGGSRRYQYDKVQRLLLEQTSRPGATSGSIIYGHDLAIFAPDGSAARARGRLAAVYDPAGSTLFAYDYQGRVAKESRQNTGETRTETAYIYAPDGSLYDLTYPDGRRLTYLKDPGAPDRVAGVQCADGTCAAPDLATQVKWHSRGRLKSLRYGSGADLLRTYTPGGQQESVGAGFGERTLFTYYVADRDLLGRPKKVTRSFGVPTSTSSPPTFNVDEYAYDLRGRVMTATLTPALDLGYGTPYEGVGYAHQSGEQGNRFFRGFSAPGSPDTWARAEWYHYYPRPGAPSGEESDRLWWMKDPVLGVTGCPPESGADGGAGGGDAGAGHEDHGCRDHGQGLGCHDAGPDQRQRDAGTHGGHGDDVGNGNHRDRHHGPSGSSGAGKQPHHPPVDRGPQPPACGEGPKVDRTHMLEDFIALLAAIRAELAGDEQHWDRSYNRIGGRIARFLAKYHVTPRTFMQSLLSQGAVREGFVRIFDRRAWNGPRRPQDVHTAVNDLLDAAAAVPIDGVVDAFERALGDDICYGYDQTGNLVWEGYNNPPQFVQTPGEGCAVATVRVPCDTRKDPQCLKLCPTGTSGVCYIDVAPSYHDLLCYTYDAWGHQTEMGVLADTTSIPPALKDNPCADPSNVVPLWRYAYDYKGRRVSMTLESGNMHWRRSFVYDTGDRLLTERLSTTVQPDPVPQRHYYWLGGEPLAQEVLAERKLVWPQGELGCGACGGGTLRGPGARAGLLALVLGLAVLAGVRALHAGRRGQRGRAGSLGGVAALAVVAGALVPAACWRVVPLPSPLVYYYHNDFLGTPQAMSDAGGPKGPRVVWAQRYEPFGQARIYDDADGDGQVVTNALRFPGQYDDATKPWFHGVGPYYNMARYYDPAIGRYTQVDPLAARAEFLPAYAYASNGPTYLADESGLAPYPDKESWNKNEFWARYVRDAIQGLRANKFCNCYFKQKCSASGIEGINAPVYRKDNCGPDVAGYVGGDCPAGGMCLCPKQGLADAFAKSGIQEIGGTIAHEGSHLACNTDDNIRWAPLDYKFAWNYDFACDPTMRQRAPANYDDFMKTVRGATCCK